MGLSVATPVDVSTKGERLSFDTSIVPDRVAFIGLGAMGFGMASWLVHEKFSVCGYDVSIVDFCSLNLLSLIGRIFSFHNNLWSLHECFT